MFLFLIENYSKPEIDVDLEVKNYEEYLSTFEFEKSSDLEKKEKVLAEFRKKMIAARDSEYRSHFRAGLGEFGSEFTFKSGSGLIINTLDFVKK